MTDKNTESNAIKTQLNGPITSLEAVANNIDGEWKRLTNRDIHSFTDKDVQNILINTGQSLGIRPLEKTGDIFNKF